MARLDVLLTGYDIIDEVINRASSTPVKLDHDTIRGNADLEIWTGASGTGTQLVLTTDYTVSDEDADLTAEAGIAIYTKIAIINGAYHNMSLYVTYKTIGDYASNQTIIDAIKESEYGSTSWNRIISKTVSDIGVIRKSPPKIKRMILDVLESRLSQKTRYIHPRELGFDTNGLLFGTLISEASSSNIFPASMMIAAPYDTSGTYTLALSISALGSASLDNLTVSKIRYVAGEGGASVSVNTITRSGNNWSATITNASPGEVVGWRIDYPNTVPITDNMSIDSFSITTPSGSVYTQITSDFMHECPIVFRRGGSTNAVAYKKYKDGLESRSFGAKSGQLPLVIFASPYGVDDTTAGSADRYANTIKGYDQSNTPLLRQAFILMINAQRNGYPMPALILLPGNYAQHSATSAMLGITNYPLSKKEEFYIGCVTGQAVLSVAGGLYNHAILFSDSTDYGHTINLANITTDAGFIYPFAFNGMDANMYHCIALGAGSESLDVDCFDLDNSDFILEDCEAHEAFNDGFNFHGYGHIALVNCISADNIDDGFSPHDFCTYAVYGGLYSGNGKGNIVPAHGAQGYCINVNSSDVTGLSPRVGGGNGYGGYFILRDTTGTRPTICVLVDCVSTSDRTGVTVLGTGAFCLVFGGSIVTATEDDFRIETNEFYGPGLLEISNVQYSGTIDTPDIKYVVETDVNEIL